jgi:predicted Zn-dependent protease
MAGSLAMAIFKSMFSPILKVLSSTILSLSLVGCMQTANLKNQDRQQLIVIPEKMWHKNADKAYQDIVNDLTESGAIIYDQRLTQIMQTLMPVAYEYRPDSRHWNWQISALMSNKLNAHGFAGGKVLLHQGIYWSLNLTDDELAYVIAHEMAHSLREHGRERLSTSVLLGPLALLKNGGRSIKSTIEQEADLLGLEMIKKANYDPNAAITFWEKYQNETIRRAQNGGDEPLMTRDFIEQRLQAIESRLSTL